MRVVLRNQGIVLVLLVANYYLDESRGRLPGLIGPPPTITTVVASLFFFQIVREITFYYSHRLLHHPSLYKWIHKQHHTWTSPVAIAAAYCHPVEHVVSNLIPIALGKKSAFSNCWRLFDHGICILGPGILQSHTLLLWAYTVYASIETLTVHSGFHLPLLKSPEFHDFHHLK